MYMIVVSYFVMKISRAEKRVLIYYNNTRSYEHYVFQQQNNEKLWCIMGYYKIEIDYRI